MEFTILILVSATSQWLSLPRANRDEFVEKELQPVLKKHSSGCIIKLYDSDFMHSRISDFMIIETTDLKEYGYLIGYLRESKTFAAPYFKIEDIIIGVSNNFRGSLNIQDISTLG